VSRNFLSEAVAQGGEDRSATSRSRPCFPPFADAFG